MSWLHDRKWLSSAVLCTALLSAEAAAAADRMLVLEVLINGRRAGRVAEFIDRDGTLHFLPSDLVELGIVVPPELVAEARPVPFSSLPDLQVRVDEAKQTLIIAASDASLRPTELGAPTAARLTPLTRAEFGALLNYDAAVTYSDNRATGGALVDLRLFGPYGVIDSSALVSIAPPRGQGTFVRLDTTYTFTQPSKLRRWRLGDVVTGALPWTRAVRLGGAQVASDFGLRPDLITYPLPVISSSAAVPSTVNVMVNGISQFSESVEPGPFAIRSLPVVSGAGNISVTVMDALGQESLITLPFYSSTTLLRPGLASYSLEIGAVREDYGLASDHYSGWAVNQSSRLGLKDWLTLESHAEASDGMALLGGGAALLVGNLGIANVALAGSTGRSAGETPSTGVLVSAGFQRVSPRFNFGLNGTYASSGFRDIAARHGAPVPKSTLNASLGYQMGRWGSVGLAYNRRVSRAEPSSLPETENPDPTVELITGSYSASLAGVSNIHATGFKDLRGDGAYGVGLGVNIPMGGGAYGSLEGSLDNGRASYSASIVNAAQRQGDFGYRLRVSEGSAPRQSFDAEFLGSWGRVSGGVERYSGQLAARAGMRGAIVLASGELFASDRIDDSFAVVSTGDVAGVPVLYENRLVGRTNSRGKLLIPSLRSFQDNRLSVDTTLLPPDVEVGETTMLVRPADRAGTSVDFEIWKVNAALVTLHDGAGRPLPLGSIAKVEGAGDRPVGHDGAAYVTGLMPSNRMKVDLPDGSHCGVQFDFQPVSGDIPLIGPLQCL